MGSFFDEEPSEATKALTELLETEEPSAEDIKITRQLVAAGKIIDIKVMDHVIVGCGDEERQDGYVSLREAGVVAFDA